MRSMTCCTVDPKFATHTRGTQTQQMAVKRVTATRDPKTIDVLCCVVLFLCCVVLLLCVCCSSILVGKNVCFCFTSNENCHFSSEKTVTPQNGLLIFLGKETHSETKSW